MAMWFDEVYQDQVRLGFRVEEYVFRDRSEFQQIDIFDTVPFGRALALDNVYQTSVGDEYLYHEMLVHPALATAPSIENVLIIGGGDGGAAREVLRYPEVQRCTMVELDKMVVKACQDHLTEMNVPWDDPRLRLHFEDGQNFINHTRETFDVILVDGPDPIGPAKVLYTNAFYAACRDRLTQDGVFAAQSEAPHLMHKEFARIIKTLRHEFQKAEPYFGPVPIYVCGTWAYGYATKTATFSGLKMDRAAAIEAECRYWNREVHRAAFAQSNQVIGLLK